MGLILGVMTPKLKEINDKISLTQTLDYVMNVLDQKIIEISASPGNDRVLNIRIKKGELVIDGSQEIIRFVLQSANYKASQPGVPIKLGNVLMITEEVNKKYNINLILNYSSMNLTFQDKDEVKILTAANTDYGLIIQNKGNRQINFDLA